MRNELPQNGKTCILSQRDFLSNKQQEYSSHGQRGNISVSECISSFLVLPSYEALVGRAQLQPGKFRTFVFIHIFNIKIQANGA